MCSTNNVYLWRRQICLFLTPTGLPNKREQLGICTQDWACALSGYISKFQTTLTGNGKWQWIGDNFMNVASYIRYLKGVLINSSTIVKTEFKVKYIKYLQHSNTCKSSLPHRMSISKRHWLSWQWQGDSSNNS